MSFLDGKDRDYRVLGLSYYQTGILFLCIAPALIVFGGYQIVTGRVFTKSGEIPLNSALGWPWVLFEFGVAILGIVRGVKMMQR